MNPYLKTNDEAKAVAIFGNFIRQWFDTNGWPQSLCEDWSKANDEQGPWASQMSHLMNGKLTPKPFFFKRLHQFNLAVAEGRVGAADFRTKARMKLGEALRRSDGTPLSTGDFLELYLGIQTPSKSLISQYRTPNGNI